MKKLILTLTTLTLLQFSSHGQSGIGVTALLNEGRNWSDRDRLTINENPAIDTLISRHIMANLMKQGVEGWRIQIYRGGHRTANEDANKVRARFMEEYPDIRTYLTFDRPNWFKVKVGDFRTREEAAKVFFSIQARYPEAYLVRDVIGYKNPVK